MKKVNYLSELIGAASIVPCWISQCSLHNLSDHIDTIPENATKLYDLLRNAHEAAVNLADATQPIEDHAIELILSSSYKIHSDIETRHLLETKKADLSDKLNETCATVEEAEIYLNHFDINIKQCLSNYQNAVVPQLSTITKRIEEFSNVALNATDRLEKDIEAFITLVNDTTDNVQANSDSAVLILETCIKTSGSECEQFLNKMFKRIQTLLNWNIFKI